MRFSNLRSRQSSHTLGATVLLLSLAAWAVVVSAQTTELRLVSTAWSPFTNEPGQPRFALDLVEAGLGRVGIKTSTTIVDAAQFTSSLLSGNFDGSAAAWKDAERERTLLGARCPGTRRGGSTVLQKGGRLRNLLIEAS